MLRSGLCHLTVVFCSARGDGKREVRGERGKSSSSLPRWGVWKPQSMPVCCGSPKAKPNIDFKAQDSSGLGKTWPQCVLEELWCSWTSHPEKRYGTNPGSGTVLPPFLALGRFKLSSSFLISYHEGSLIWTKSELKMVLFHSIWAGSHWHTGQYFL